MKYRRNKVTGEVLSAEDFGDDFYTEDWTGTTKKVYDDYIKPTYVELRREEYPVTGDQLDVIWKQFNQLRLNGTPLIQEADDMLGDILATKSKYPKE